MWCRFSSSCTHYIVSNMKILRYCYDVITSLRSSFFPSSMKNRVSLSRSLVVYKSHWMVGWIKWKAWMFDFFFFYPKAILCTLDVLHMHIWLTTRMNGREGTRCFGENWARHQNDVSVYYFLMVNTKSSEYF